MHKFWLRLFIFAFNIGLLAVICLCYYVYTNIKDLPSYKELSDYNPPVVTRFYSGDGKLLEEYAKEHRLFTPIDAIPQSVKNAFIAAEDKNFYSHSGVDFLSILRSAVQNVANIGSGKNLVGGSTITQQVVKNFLLTNERTLERKIKEAILSFKISKIYSKDKILELYLNQIFLGHKAYGVTSAALNYFNKSIDDLNIAEAAFLATLPKAPSNYDPQKNMKAAISRRNWVLERMYNEGMISEEAMKQNEALPIELHKREADTVVQAGFFAESARRFIVDKYGEKALYEGGLYVLTSLDSKLQNVANQAFRHGLMAYDKKYGYKGAFAKSSPGTYIEDLNKIYKTKDLAGFEAVYVTAVENYNLHVTGLNFKTIIKLSKDGWPLYGRDPRKKFNTGDIILVQKGKNGYSVEQIPRVNGGMVVMNPNTGRILAMVGGFSFQDSKYNRVTQARRQPGSSFKPFVYLYALENGFTPASIVEDVPMELEQGPGMPLWRPKNYHVDFLGPTTLRRGLELSRNTMTVNLAQMIGVENIVAIAKRFNIADDPKPVYSMVLGAMETSLIRMTTAYSSLVNGGRKVDSYYVDKIQDKNGDTIYRGDERKCEFCNELVQDGNGVLLPKIIDDRERLTDEQTAYQLVSILEGVVKHTSSAKPIKDLGRTLAGKTGTTNDSKDAWYIGFSQNLLVGIYIGYDTPKSLGSKETGSTVSQPIFVDFMKEVTNVEDDIPFRMPPGLKLVRINYETGLPSMSQYGTIFEVFKPGTEPKSVDAFESIEKQ